MAEDDKISTILVDVGVTRKAVENLENDLHEIKERVQLLGDTTVRRPECQAREGFIGNQIAELNKAVRDVAADVRAVRKSTSADYPAVRSRTTSQIGVPIPSDGFAVNEQTLSAKNPFGKERSLGDWVKIVTGVISIVTFIGGGLWAAFSFIARVEGLLAAQEQQTMRLQRVTREAPRVVYVTVPPDAGVPDAAPVRPRRIRH